MDLWISLVLGFLALVKNIWIRKVGNTKVKKISFILVLERLGIIDFAFPVRVLKIHSLSLNISMQIYSFNRWKNK